MNRVLRLALALATAALFAAKPLAAQTVAVIVASPPGLAAGRALEELLAGGMDALFESGRIVTNGKAVELGRGDWGLDPRDLRECREGFVDYVAFLYAGFAASELKPGLPRPLSLEFRIYDVHDGAVAAEGSLAPPPGRDESEDGLGRAMRALGREAAVAAFAALSKSRPVGFGGSI
jgi:hypothetical protein